MLTPVNDNFIYKELCKLNPSKSTGTDNIPARFVKDAASVLTKPICHIVNLSFDQSIVPNELKNARVVPLFKKKLHICQNKTVRFIKNLGPRSHIGFSELDSLGMLNVDFRVKQLRLGYAHKIFNDRCPSYLSEDFVKTSDIHRHNTRGSSEIFVVPSVSGVAATTFYYSAIKDWNSLPSEVKIRNYYNSFKGEAKAYLRTQLQLSETDNFIYY